METIQTKCCSKCGIEKSLTEFYKHKNGLYGKTSDCKICRKNQVNDYYKNNQNVKKEYIKKNRNKILQYKKEYRKNNPSTEYNRKYFNEKYHSDKFYKLQLLIRNSILRGLKSNKEFKTQNIIGCTWIELRNYFESKFQNGMTWENQGQWHIDHIIPLASAKTEEEIYRLNHYTNLQPLWAEDNLRKSDKISVEWGNEY